MVGVAEKELEKVMNVLREGKKPVLKGRPFSCACGEATFKKGVDKSLHDVLKRADEVMYDEKKRQKGLAG